MTLIAHWYELNIVERTARLRSLAMAARLLAGPQADPLCAALRRAELDASALAAADLELANLPTVTMRKLLATFAGAEP